MDKFLNLGLGAIVTIFIIGFIVLIMVLHGLQ